MSFAKQDDIYEDVESSTASSICEGASFIGNTTKKPGRRCKLNFALIRIALELCLAGVLLILVATDSIHFSHKATEHRRFGPSLRRKEVILGNAAGLGPALEYNNQDMLSNRTEMARIHRNWQQLFPSE